MNDLPDTPATETAPRPTLERWLTGTRFSALPARGATHPPPLLSFEFFPPKTEGLEQQLWPASGGWSRCAPRFVSVTYGAGGSTRQRTHATVTRIVRETGLVPAAHLTCVGATREGVDEVARQYWDAGVRHIVRLRGDAPPGRDLPAASEGLFVCRGPRRRAEARCAVRDLRGSLSRGPSPGDITDERPRQPEAQARRRRQSGDHQLLLRHSGLPAIPGPVPGRRHHRARSCQASCR